MKDVSWISKGLCKSDDNDDVVWEGFAGLSRRQISHAHLPGPFKGKWGFEGQRRVVQQEKSLSQHQ